MPQPNTKTKYRPLPAALLTLVVLLASTLLIWLAVVRPLLGKGRTETLCDNFDRSELLADGDTAAQVFTYDKALYTIGLEFYLPGAQPQGELEVVLSDADTGEESVIWTTYPFATVPRYYTSSKKSFCAFIEVNGERKAKYKRMLNMKISGEAIERLEEEGFRGPVRKRKKWQLDESYDSRDYQQSLTYYAYAKDLCEHYNFDRNKYRLCVKEKRFVAITKSDFAKLKEDLQFLDNVLKTVLVTYQGYFRERFVDGLSIRKYAEAHQLNRGSVDYQQKKFFSALASLLKERDEAEGICRLLKPAQK